MVGAVPRPGPMSEDERLKLLETVLEAQALLADAALELRRRLGRPSPLAKTAVRAERQVFRLKSELQRSDVDEPEPEARFYRGGPFVEINRLRHGKGRGEES